jgi:hypothetical protein
MDDLTPPYVATTRFASTTSSQAPRTTSSSCWRPPISSSSNLLLALTAHGFGHATQSAPVINRLRTLRPGLGLVILADLPRDWLATRFAGGFHHVEMATDPGLQMRGPFEVDWQHTIDAYLDFHQASTGVSDAIRRLIEAYRIGLVLADVPWIPLQAAARAGVPSAALSSLNWADILRACPCPDERLAAVIAAIETAYQAASLFIRTEPAMPMTWLHTKSVGPVAMQGRAQAGRLRDHLRIRPEQPLGLLQFGGIDGLTRIDLKNLPHVHWIVTGHDVSGVAVTRAEALMAELDASFVDLVASVDFMVAKPGYGSFAEAACHGVRVLAVERAGWPEAPFLEAWLGERVPICSIKPLQLYAGDFEGALERLLQQASRAPVPASGVDEAAHLLAELIA